MVVAHDVLLRGASIVDGDPWQPGPAILETTDANFIEALLQDLRTSEGRAKLQASKVLEGPDNVPLLYQPVQRTYHLALLEAFCELIEGSAETPAANPRLDPAQIVSAGFVVRRVVSGGYQAWLEDSGRVRGWVKLKNQAEEDADPDPAQRRTPSSGNVQIDRRLALLPVLETFAERTSPAFVAPPDVCEAAGRTVVYGVVPTASSETAELAYESFTPQFDADELKETLVPFLLKGDAGEETFLASEVIDADSIKDAGQTSKAGELKKLRQMVQRMAMELDVFTPDGDGTGMRAILADLDLVYQKSPKRTETALEVFEDLFEILVGQNAEHPTKKASAGRHLSGSGGELGNATSVKLPVEWPVLDAQQVEEVEAAVLAAVTARFASIRPRTTRFADDGSKYVLRAFARVQRGDDCPPRLVWSPHSPPFKIRPWYEGGNAPPPVVPMPDVTDKGLLKALKPNVAFQIPGGVFDKFGIDLDTMVEGEEPPGSNLGIGFICSLNIAIVFVIAFILILVFALVLNIAFFWMAFLKICLPIPVNKPEE